jgi:GH25 family lysozyme M1 (1,4-beta-N-acetylmuramidase)
MLDARGELRGADRTRGGGGVKYEELGYMGRYAKAYKPRLISVNRIANEVFGLPSRRFIFSSAMVVQQKKFPDVSFYQGEINFYDMRQKTDALIIRAGQNLWKDSRFDRNWLEAKRHGMKRGSYWFYDDRIDPGKQADLWVSVLKDDMPEMEIWADWENSYGGAFGGLRNVVAFMQAMEARLPGVKVGLYTGYWWFRDNSNAVTNASQYNYLRTRPLFEAWYTSNVANVLIPNPWTSIFLWQFGTPAVGREYGVATQEIDMNYINMTEADFQIRYSTTTTLPEPPTEPGAIMSRYTITTPSAGARLRPNHDTNNTAHGTIPGGTVLASDEDFVANVAQAYQYVGDRWAKVSYAFNSITYVGWVAVTHLGGAVCTLVDNGATEHEPAEYVADFDVTLTAPDGKRYAGTVAGLTLRAVE